MSEAPKRAHILMLKVQGDTKNDVAQMLRSIAIDYERGQINNGCSGGVSSSATWDTLNSEKTPEEFQEELKRYVEWLRATTQD